MASGEDVAPKSGRNGERLSVVVVVVVVHCEGRRKNLL